MSSSENYSYRCDSKDGSDPYKPRIREGRLPSSFKALIAKDVAIILQSLESGVPQIANAHLRKINVESDYADIRQDVVCRIIASEHPDVLLKAIANVKDCSQGFCQTGGCQTQHLPEVLEAVLGATNAKLPFDYARPVINCIAASFIDSATQFVEAMGPNSELPMKYRADFFAYTRSELANRAMWLVLSLSRHPSICSTQDSVIKSGLRRICPALSRLIRLANAQVKDDENTGLIFWIACLEFVHSLPISETGDPACNAFFKDIDSLATPALRFKKLADDCVYYQVDRANNNFVCMSCYKFTQVSMLRCSEPMCKGCGVNKMEEKSYKLCQYCSNSMVCSAECHVKLWKEGGHKLGCSRLAKGGLKKEDRPDWTTTFKNVNNGKMPAKTALG